VSVPAPDFVEVDENQFVPYDEVTGGQLKHAVRLALQNSAPGKYYLGIRKAMTAFRRAGGTDSDVVTDVLSRRNGHHRIANDDNGTAVSRHRSSQVRPVHQAEFAFASCSGAESDPTAGFHSHAHERQSQP